MTTTGRSVATISLPVSSMRKRIASSLRPGRRAEHEQQVVALVRALVDRVLRLRLGNDERVRGIGPLTLVDGLDRSAGTAALERARRDRIAVARIRARSLEDRAEA